MAETTIGGLVSAGVLSMGDGYRTKRPEHGLPGYRIIRVADVRDGAVFLDGDDFVSESYVAQMGGKVARPGDVLLTTKGTVGRVAVMPATSEKAVYSPQLCYFRVRDQTILDPAYLRYWFQSAEFTSQSSFLQGNTDMAPYISLADLRSTKISIAARTEQRAIAEVLGALDDKIAANTRIATTADALANAEFARRVIDLSPSALTFADVGKVGGGGTPRSKVPEFWSGDVPWLTPTDVTALPGPYVSSTSRTISEAGLSSISSALYPVGSIFMTSRATIGAFAIAERPMAVNQGFIVVEPTDPRLLYWWFHEMRSRVPEFLDYANGATFMELSRGNFKKLPVRIGEPTEMLEFSERAQVIHARASAALRENRALATTRDALLPQLMSGRLQVRDAERLVSDAV